jgi:predicted 3-demethylubiquinone-9 3-methyltransferase (glyoxalase superfamily)
MERIIPYLWFDSVAGEAVRFYISLFDDSEITFEQRLEGTPSGDDAAAYEFKLAGQIFGAINGGPYFQLNPSISLMVLCDTKEEVQELWDKLIDGGKELMPLQAYDFSEFYGWLEDKYGVSWQIISAEGMDYDQKIVPQLMFSGAVTGKAKEAMEYYTEIFKDGKIENIYEYGEGEAHHPDAKIAHAEFTILGEALLAADNGEQVDYEFNEAFSLLVMCVTQAEIDYYWEKLSADPEAEQCGWLKDKYGVSWQIAPSNMNDLLSKGTQKQINAVVEAFLPMKKLDIEKLENVWEMAKE